MIAQYHLIDVPYLGVVSDIISRDGAPSERNYPFYGLRQTLSEKCKGAAPAICFNLLSVNKKDFDFKHARRDGMQVHLLNSIEDVPEDNIHRYIEQLLYGIVNYRRDGFREFATFNMREQYTYKDEEEESDIREAEFLMDGASSYSYEEILAWQRKLPYLVKRLHDKSLQTGFHVMSAVIAKQKCIKERETDSDNRKRSIMPKELIARKIYTIRRDGTIGAPVAENISDFQQSFCPWVRGDERFRDSYYDDMQELYKICDRLNIHLEYEDPLKYTGEFISTLVSDYIIDNSRLAVNVALQQAGSGLPQSIRNIIAKLSLDELDQIPQILQDAAGKQNSPTRSECVENTIMMYFNSELFTKTEDSLITKSALGNFFMKYFMVTKNPIRMKSLVFDDNGFLMDVTKADYLLFNVLPFISENQGLGTMAMIHKSGVVLLVDTRRINRSFAWVELAKLTMHLDNYYLRQQSNQPLPTIRWYEIDDV